MLTGPAPTVTKARRLRKDMSLPEVLLWQELRKRPGGFKFRRQHPAGPYVLDFACVKARTAVEVDGAGHGMGNAPVHDEVRDEWLANQGYSVVRVAAAEVLKNIEGVVSFVVERCASASPLHQPMAGPPPRAGEDL
ncbi:endonuclease domain-containing protein [Sphingomonas sp.]|uniref:endonuclease domain-containing protein n=1 Tax=Sphingomonas sp. TaxID=28214 RepID=UPI002FC5DD8D